jgi:hypothetical protein
MRDLPDKPRTVEMRQIDANQSLPKGYHGLRVLALCVFSMLFLALTAGTTYGASPKTYHCWRIEQSNGLYGACTIYACSQAIKVVFKNGKWTNLAKGPNWLLYILNPDQKIYCTTTLENWKCNLVQLGSIVDEKKMTTVRRHEEKTIAGLTAVRIDYEPIPGRKDWVQKRVGRSTYWVAKDINLPDPVTHVICGESGLSNLHAIPLRTEANHHFVAPLDTTSITKVDVPASFFDMPGGYKYTDEAADLMNAGVGDIIRDMTGP